MPNIGGPRYSRRLLLAKVVTSVVLYGSPVWAGAMKETSYKMKIGAVNRLCAL